MIGVVEEISATKSAYPIIIRVPFTYSSHEGYLTAINQSLHSQKADTRRKETAGTVISYFYWTFFYVRVLNRVPRGKGCVHPTHTHIHLHIFIDTSALPHTRMTNKVSHKTH